MARRGGAGSRLVFNRPIFSRGYRNTKIQTISGGGDASGETIDDFAVTVITATAANLVYTLPNPKAGQHQYVSVHYTGDADDLIIACAATSQGFDGTAQNTIVSTSSQVHGAFLFVGMSTSQWMVFMGSRGRLRGASTAISADDFVFTDSTVSTTTDLT